MRVPLVTHRELAADQNRKLKVLYVFEHKMYCILIQAPYTRIVIVWHINNIPQGFYTVKFVMIFPCFI